MRKLIILLTLLTAVLITAVCTEVIPKKSIDSQGNQEKGAVVEVTQLEQIDASLQNGPVLVKIGAKWCTPCQELKPILNELATEYDGKATIMSADADQSPKLADYFGVSSIPDSYVIMSIENGEYIYMQEDGKVTKDRFKARILGFRDKAVFENILDFAIKKGNVKST